MNYLYTYVAVLYSSVVQKVDLYDHEMSNLPIFMFLGLDVFFKMLLSKINMWFYTVPW